MKKRSLLEGNAIHDKVVEQYGAQLLWGFGHESEAYPINKCGDQ
jgi:hypothetical protein